ncbi:MAG: VOC family protein [Chloroflexi bacterium]|nr:VOC family protein [Chloroflexota bacterium]
MKIKRLLCDNAAVVNLDEAVAFFRDVLGANMAPEMPHGKHFGFRARGAWLGSEEPYRLELIQGIDDQLPLGRSTRKLAPRYIVVSLEVENIDEAIAELRAKGVQVSDKMDMGPTGFDKLGFKDCYECMILPKSACGLGIELVEFKKGPPAGSW